MQNIWAWISEFVLTRSDLSLVVLGVALFVIASCGASYQDDPRTRPEAIESWPVFAAPGFENCYVNVRWDQSRASDRDVFNWAESVRQKAGRGSIQDYDVVQVDFVSDDLLVLTSGGNAECQTVDQSVLNSLELEGFPAPYELSQAEIFDSGSDPVTLSAEFQKCAFSIYLKDFNLFKTRSDMNWKSRELIDVYMSWGLGIAFAEGGSESFGDIGEVIENENDAASVYTNRNCHLSGMAHSEAFAQTLKLFDIKASAADIVPSRQRG